MEQDGNNPFDPNRYDLMQMPRVRCPITDPSVVGSIQTAGIIRFETNEHGVFVSAVDDNSRLQLGDYILGANSIRARTWNDFAGILAVGTMDSWLLVARKRLTPLALPNGIQICRVDPLSSNNFDVQVRSADGNVFVVSVEEHSSGWQAGLRVDDRILKFGDKFLDDVDPEQKFNDRLQVMLTARLPFDLMVKRAGSAASDGGSAPSGQGGPQQEPRLGDPGKQNGDHSKQNGGAKSEPSGEEDVEEGDGLKSDEDEVNEEAQEYMERLAKHVCDSRLLAIQSAFCRHLLCRCPSAPSLAIPSCVPADGLLDALYYVESGSVDVCTKNLRHLFFAASRLEMPQLQHRLEQYMRAVSMLGWSSFLVCWDACQRAPATVLLRDEMMRRAADGFGDLYVRNEWPRLNDHLVRQLFLRPDLKAASPMDVFEAALKWIAGNPSGEPAAADRIMSAVPFYRMPEIDRLQCLQTARKMHLIKFVQPRVVISTWHGTSAATGRHTASDLQPRPCVDFVGGKSSVDKKDAKAVPISTSSSSSFSEKWTTKIMVVALLVAKLAPSVRARSVAPAGQFQTSSAGQRSRSTQQKRISSPTSVGTLTKQSTARSKLMKENGRMSGRPIRFSSSTLIRKMQNEESGQVAQGEVQTAKVITPPVQEIQLACTSGGINILKAGKPIRFRAVTKIIDKSQGEIAL